MFFKKLQEKVRKLPPAVIFFVILLYWEILTKTITCRRFFDLGLVFMPVFSAVLALGMQAVCLLFRQKGQRIAARIMLSIIFVVFAAQTVYFFFFNKYLITYSLVSGGVNQVLTGKINDSTVAAVIDGIPMILLFAIPLVLYFIFAKRIQKPYEKYKNALKSFLASLILHIVAVIVISFVPNLSYIQNGLYDPNYAVGSFGLMRTEALDLKYNLFGFSQDLRIEEENVTVPEDDDIDDASKYNVQKYDFDALEEKEEDETLKEMHGYFADQMPTKKNAYTGMYKGYNLITIVAEGFSPYAIDPKLTPTLYKMQRDGFKFTNFYTPIWGVSTSDGEYVANTGLLPKAGVWSFFDSAENDMPYCLGNMFKSIGVNKTFAYHNNSAGYYRRDLSHPNMGYTFKAMGNGLEEYVQNVWPQSDLEMIAGSVSDYIQPNEQFCAYYMTVSGHREYDPEINAMVAKNWHLVEDLPCSDMLKSYYACNIELDRAMQALMFALEEAGVADRTVITITPDHYPYGLEDKTGDIYGAWEELLGHEVDLEFELYKSCFLLYCSGTKNPPVIDKVCYSADILPTLLNLFGFEYDSRLLAGSDILSDSDGLVILSNRAFITPYGSYNATEDEFIPSDPDYFSNEEEMEEYVESMQAVVNNTLGISAKILETDYYGYLKNPQEYTQPQEMRSVTVIIYSFCVVAVAVLITVYVLYRRHQKKTVSPQDEPSDLQNV